MFSDRRINNKVYFNKKEALLKYLLLIIGFFRFFCPDILISEAAKETN